VPESPITEDDIMALVREGTEKGTVESTEEDFITSVFTFSDQTVRSLMTPRPQMVALDINTPWAKVLAAVSESGYSRLPVYKGSLDNILGVLHVKDLLQVWGQAEGIELGSLLRPPLYVIESQRAVVAFQQLQRSSTALALVLDEYGQVAGLITLEDMLEELVGDIVGASGQPEAIKRRKDGSYLVDGILPCWELEEYLDIPEIADFARRYGFETVAGLLLALLGRIPKIGDTASWRGYTFEVVDMDGQRVDKILIVPPRPPANKQNEGVLASGAVLPPPETDTEKPE
jgi:putative hemolysin